METMSAGEERARGSGAVRRGRAGRGGRWGALALWALAVLALGGCGARGRSGGAATADFDGLVAAGAIAVTGSVAPAAVQAGDELAVAATITATRPAIVDVEVGIRGPSGASIYSVALGAQPVSPEAPLRLEDTLGIEPGDPSGGYALSVTVRHTGTGKVLVDEPDAARFTVGGAEPPPPGACSGAAVFCDDYADAALAGAYTTQRGSWTRGAGSYTATDAVVWERARALLEGDYGDFDVTLAGRSLGDAGFGLSYAAQGTDDGFAVIVHPAQFQGVYLKQLVPGRQDVDIASYPLPASAAGRAMTLRVRRAGTSVTVWLDGRQVLAGDDGGAGRHGKLGLLLSVTDRTSGSGAEFSLLRLDGATPWGGGGGGGDGGGAGTWLSGASGNGAADGRFGQWRGRSNEIGGTWADVDGSEQAEVWSIRPGVGEWADFAGPIDIANGGIFPGAGESWAAAAAGAYDSRWTTSLTRIREARQGKGTTFIRFAHEFNGDWYWPVTGGNAESFKAAWARFHALKQAIFPAAKLVWCPNDGTTASLGLDVRDAFPGAQYVDVIGVDSYNWDPAAKTAAEFAAKIDRVDAHGAPLGIERWRQFAESHGLPMAIPEWSGNAPQGDNPAFMQGLHDWLVAHGGSGPGQVVYEILFNQWTDFELWPTTKQPAAAARYESLW